MLQSSDTEKILEQLTILQEGKGGSSGDDEGSSDGYKSFVMNEFKNTQIHLTNLILMNSNKFSSRS